MTARFEIEARLQQLRPGRYDLDGAYAIERHLDGWRWFKYADPSIGGEWRRSKREAVLDLADYFTRQEGGQRCQRGAPAKPEKDITIRYRATFAPVFRQALAMHYGQPTATNQDIEDWIDALVESAAQDITFEYFEARKEQR